MTGNEKLKRIHINFAYPQKRCNIGMDYYVPVDFLPVFKRYIIEICQASVKQGRLQFLKNWSTKGKRRVQNTGKHTINKLHKVVCEILKLRPDDYGSHSWHCTEATVLADAGASKVNLKRHGQWTSDAVVKGYIANSKALRIERLNCLLPESKRKKEELGQENTEFVKYNQVVELTKEVVDLQNLPKKEEEPKKKPHPLRVQPVQQSRLCNYISGLDH